MTGQMSTAGWCLSVPVELSHHRSYFCSLLLFPTASNLNKMDNITHPALTAQQIGQPWFFTLIFSRRNIKRSKAVVSSCYKTAGVLKELLPNHMHLERSPALLFHSSEESCHSSLLFASSLSREREASSTAASASQEQFYSWGRRKLCDFSKYCKQID